MADARDDAERGGLHAPPCPAPADPIRSDAGPQDVASWRTGERTRLRAARMSLGADERAEVGRALATHLRTFLARRFGDAKGLVFSAYWPIKGEPDLRPLMADLHEAGLVVALPLVETRAAPLVFRRWTPATKMVRGHWNIPVPPPDAPVVTPDIVLAPLVGWDDAGYRLGYGGGYFDRTLAALAPRPFAIGVGYHATRIATIHPQPHDIALDAILTESGVQVEAGSATG